MKVCKIREHGGFLLSQAQMIEKCSIMATVSAGIGTEAGLSGKENWLRTSTLPCCFPNLYLIA